jgi:hypothetical protein
MAAGSPQEDNLKVVYLSDGYYIVGPSLCLPVTSYEAGEKEIQEMTKGREEE